MTSQHKNTEYSTSLFLRFRRELLRSVFNLVFRIMCDVKITGKEHIPTNGAYIVAHNHISLFEPPFILSFWPIALEAVSGADVFSRSKQQILVKAYGAIPLHRNEYDRSVIDNMLSLLSQGKSLMISPEGGRSHNISMRRALPGVAYIMHKANVPVLPVAIIGSTDELLSLGFQGEKPKLELRIGPPFILPKITGRGKERRISRQDNADLVMHKIAKLLPEKYHGVYAKTN